MSLRNTIVTTDLHLTDNARDEYRWQVFPYLEDFCKNDLVDRILVLGDITDSKDEHASEFVNRVVDSFRKLSKLANVYILKGNHDYRNGRPFFEFLDHIESIDFISSIEMIGAELWLPHTWTPMEDWKGIDFSRYDCIFMHETAKGSIASNGFKMQGIDANVGAKKSAIVLSGDIHVPQKIGQIVYPGSPYHVHFGDRFDARILWFDNDGSMESIKTYFPERFTVDVESLEDLESLDLQENDMIKVRIPTKAGDLSSFRDLRKDVMDYCKGMGVEVAGMELVKRVARKPFRDKKLAAVNVISDPVEMVKRFGHKEGLDEEVIDAGVDLVNRHGKGES